MENNQAHQMDKKVSHRIFLPSKRAKISISKDFYEKREWDQGNLVCGIDEVGRGCLAGPVVVAAVILRPNNRLKLLKDSKTLSKEELLAVSPRIIENSWYSFGIVNNYDIDDFNIYQATRIAMKQALLNLLATSPKPSVVLVDAMPLSLMDSSYESIEIHSFPRAESLSRSVAAASIIAKVKRDSLMAMYDNIIPNYQFGKHKGYATKEHQDALSLNGKSILHRETFLKKFGHLFINELNNDEQINMFDNINLNIDKENNI